MAGDTLLYSMIRVWSRPVSCPLQGPHGLAYGKGGATSQCSHPPSLMDTCTDHSVIQVRTEPSVGMKQIPQTNSRIGSKVFTRAWKLISVLMNPFEKLSK